MTSYVQLDDLLAPMGWPCSMTDPAPDLAEQLAEMTEARDAARTTARERGWQRDCAEGERDRALRRLADLQEAHADRLRQHERIVREGLDAIAERDQLREQLNHALDVLDRIGSDAACAADTGPDDDRRTVHAGCDHPTTKVGRAACRRGAGA